MLKITIPKQEYWDARTQEFVQLNAVTLRLEHSLVSLSKWEMKWHVPFFGNDSLTREQMVDYVRCMTVTQGVEPSVYLRLTESNMAAIYKYMDEPMTATWFPGEPKPCEPRIPQKSKPRPKIKVKVKALTSEAIYARMFAAHIPLESIESKFSAVNVIAVTALTNITNKAIATGERLVKALSLDPIISGFQEYETQINAVQTILANTSSKGTTLDQVNAALDELNHYADLTIYNFTEMTRNIGTFTAAGVDLDTSVAAIKGIANLAAVSGSTSQQASTAMYQLSQALASGTVKLQDWNSVVNAGMGGQVFQDALKETARVHGVAIDSMIAKEGSFRETLSKES